MIKWIVRVATCLLAVPGLAACFIEPVSSGSWQIEVEQDAGPRLETWNISGDGRLTIRRGEATLSTSVEQAGSRISGTLDDTGPGLAAPANFSATVNGDSLSGTLFTQQGNVIFRGTRLAGQ